MSEKDYHAEKIAAVAREIASLSRRRCADDDGEILFVECKFTVEGEETLGDAMKESRISFEGYCPREMYDALADSIKKVVGE